MYREALAALLLLVTQLNPLSNRQCDNSGTHTVNRPVTELAACRVHVPKKSSTYIKAYQGHAALSALFSLN